MKDWLGREYDVGDLVLYAAMSGRSVTMVLGRVTKILVGPKYGYANYPADKLTEDDKETKVQVQPIKSSRWKQHGNRNYYVDTRTGKHIDPWAGNGRHIKTEAHYRDRNTGEHLTYFASAPGDRHVYRGGYYTNAGRRVDREDREYVATEFQPWVEHRTEEAPRPVTLSITENIVKWDGEIP